MQTYTQTSTVGHYDEGLRSYMMGVYNHMMIALLVTGLTSYVFTFSKTTNGYIVVVYLCTFTACFCFGIIIRFAQNANWFNQDFVLYICRNNGT